MARPHNLATKGDFNVYEIDSGYWELRFRNKVVVCASNNRSWLYRQRARYSSWFSVISRLIQSFGE